MLAQSALNPIPHQLRDTSQLSAINAAVGTFRDPTGFTRQVLSSFFLIFGWSVLWLDVLYSRACVVLLLSNCTVA